MSDIEREEFEQAVTDRWYDSYRFTRFGDGEYYDEVLEGMWRGWQASRQALSSCSEIPNSSDPASRQALEGEAIGEVGYMIQPNWDDPSKTKGVALVDKSLAPGTKLYTHPASRQALEGEPVAWWDGDTSAAEDSFSFKLDRCYTIPLYTHPASSDEWIKCTERLPKESDGDCHDIVWVYNKGLSWVEISDLEDVKFISDYTHWMPTNLVRPGPPEQEQGQ